MDTKELFLEIEKKIEESLKKSALIEAELNGILESQQDTSKSVDQKREETALFYSKIENLKQELFDLIDIECKLHDYSKVMAKNMEKYKKILKGYLLSLNDLSVWDKIKLKFGK